MKRSKALFAGAFAAAMMAGCQCDDSNKYVDATTPKGVQPTLISDYKDMDWQVVFSDEFGGSEVDQTKWEISNSDRPRASRPDISIEEWYWKPENVWCEGGNLVLKVDKPKEGVMNCGAICTIEMQKHRPQPEGSERPERPEGGERPERPEGGERPQFINVEELEGYMYQYGYMEARIDIGDATKGTHTALWLQSPNMGHVDGTANDGCEVDVVESAWDTEYTEAVVHFDGYGEDHQSLGMPYNPVGMHDGFHVYGLYWDEDVLKIYYDGEYMTEFTGKWVPRAMEFLLLSAGASFGVEGDKYFKDQPIGYLTEAKVDYIRVWQAPGCGM